MGDMDGTSYVPENMKQAAKAAAEHERRQRHPNLAPIPCPEHRKVKQYEPYVDPDDGMLWMANACRRCDKFIAYDGFSCPVGESDNYCWGHDREDAIEPFRSALQRLVDLKDGPRDDAYRACKEQAWADARAVLSGSTGDQT